eukprot:4894931-Pyramimonas_sp.AAC.1
MPATAALAPATRRGRSPAEARWATDHPSAWPTTRCGRPLPASATAPSARSATGSTPGARW